MEGAVSEERLDSMSERTNRVRVASAVELEVVVACLRRCALCFGLNANLAIKDGQIAHADRDPQNNSPDNLVWLCLPHHAKYDSRSRQAKGFLVSELRHHRDALVRHLKEG